MKINTETEKMLFDWVWRLQLELAKNIAFRMMKEESIEYEMEEWDDMASSNQAFFLKEARAEACIPDKSYLDIVRNDQNAQEIIHNQNTNKMEDSNENLNFGQALEAIKQGKLVQRKGWNGKGMHIFLEEHFEFLVPAGSFKGQKRQYDPVICMYTAQGTTQPGWNASQADMLSNDWQIVQNN